MKTFEIQVTENLERIIEVEAETFDEAVSIVEEKYRQEEIVLDSSDFQGVTFEKKDYQVEYRNLVDDLIKYCYEEEERHYNEFEDDEKPADHIFLKIKRLKELNSL
jgi:DpnD/PcfM-like protein